MNQNRKRPKHIQELIDHVNHTMCNESMKLDETNRLFFSIQEFLIHHGWYRGFNFFDTAEYVDRFGNIQVGHRLHGSDQGYEYIQLM